MSNKTISKDMDRYWEGYNSFKCNVGDNPYPSDSEDGKIWQEGFSDAKNEEESTLPSNRNQHSLSLAIQ